MIRNVCFIEGILYIAFIIFYIPYLGTQLTKGEKVKLKNQAISMLEYIEQKSTFSRLSALFCHRQYPYLEFDTREKS